MLEKCKAKTSKGNPCKNSAVKGSHYCAIHHKLSSKRRLYQIFDIKIVSLIIAAIVLLFGNNLFIRVNDIVINRLPKCSAQIAVGELLRKPREENDFGFLNGKAEDLLGVNYKYFYDRIGSPQESIDSIHSWKCNDFFLRLTVDKEGKVVETYLEVEVGNSIFIPSHMGSTVTIGKTTIREILNSPHVEIKTYLNTWNDPRDQASIIHRRFKLATKKEHGRPIRSNFRHGYMISSADFDSYESMLDSKVTALFVRYDNCWALYPEDQQGHTLNLEYYEKISDQELREFNFRNTINLLEDKAIYQK
jgi:hypothetical protein